MKKIIIIFCFFLFDANADKQVTLDLKATVDPVVNITRDDCGGTIDVFSAQGASFTITYNGSQGVEVRIASKNNWLLLNESSPGQSIHYQCLFNNQPVENGIVLVPCAAFTDGRYRFGLIFKAKNPDAAAYAPGTYGDGITVEVIESSG